jgi:hypothetical protein
MSERKMSPRILVLAGASAVALLAGGASARAGMSEMDSYTQAVASAGREDALAFINEFPESPLVDDLIESLPSVVGPQVCADLSGGGPRLAQDACKKFQGPLAATPAVIAAPVVPPAPTPLKIPALSNSSGAAGAVCEYSSCEAAPAVPTGGGEKSTGTDASGGNSAGNASGAAIPGTDARIGGSLNASGSGNTPDETKRGDVDSTASGNVTGSIGDTRSGSVDGSIGGNVDETGNRSVDGSVGASIGDTGRATVGGSVGGSVGADSDGRGIDGDMRGGVKAKLYF